MTVAVIDSGSQTATISTEHTLSTQTGAGVFVLAVDIAALASGDQLELRIYGKARSSDTERLLYVRSFAFPVVELLVESIPVVSPHDWKATLKQTAGTGRAYPWAVYST